MSKVYDVKATAAARTLLNTEAYEAMYQRSIDDNEGFWAEQASIVDWIKPFSKVKDVS